MERFGESLKSLQRPQEVVDQIVFVLQKDETKLSNSVANERSRLEERLTLIRKRMDAAYTDRLDGKVPEEFCLRMSSDWQMDEVQTREALDGIHSASQSDRVPNTAKFFEIANLAYFQYVSQNPAGLAGLVKTVFELFCMRAKSKAHIQIPLQPNRPGGQIGRLVSPSGRFSNFQLCLGDYDYWIWVSAVRRITLRNGGLGIAFQDDTAGRALKKNG